MRKILFRLHQIIGLLCAVTIMVALITGAMLIFEQELTELFHRDRYTIEASAQNTPMDYEPLIMSLENQTGEAVKSLTMRPESNDTWIAETYESPRARYFFNPYSGEVVDRFVYGESFFFKVMALHRWLMISPAGKTIMGISCILFSLILLSGLWLWMPKSIKGLKARLTFKKGAGAKRKLFDWHVVLGFYLTPLLLIMSITGPTWSFPWYRAMLLDVFGAEGTYVNKRKEQKAKGAEPYMLTQEEWSRFQTFATTLPAYNSLTFNLPESAGRISFRVNPGGAISNKVSMDYSYDPINGKVIKSEKWDDLNKTTRLRYWFFALHTGSFAGLWSKWIYLIVCLFASSLPVTGFFWWYNKDKAKSK